VTVKVDGSGMDEPLREGDGGVGFLCALTFTPEDSLLTHDMAHAHWVNPAGGVLKSVPLEKIMGSSAGSVTSSDTCGLSFRPDGACLQSRGGGYPAFRSSHARAEFRPVPA
jgi:hypothetical protein